MRIRLVGSVAGLSFLLLTCVSCQLSEYDTNSDGVVTRQEFISALLSSACDEQSESEETEEAPTSEDEPAAEPLTPAE